MQWKHVPLSIGTNALPFAWTKLGRTLRDTFASVPILGSALPQALGTAASGTSADAAREDHVHAHGDLLGGTLHSSATQLAAGFMSEADKIKLDLLAPGGGGGLAPTATLVTLAAIPSGGLPDGTTIYVNDVEDIYVLDKAAAHTVDGVTVLAATGGGFWIARHHGRWDDMMGDISEGVGTGALTYEAWEGTPTIGYPNHKQYYFRHNQPDELSFRFQFSHQWLRGSSVYPHMHITPCADPAAPQVMTVRGYYYWTVEGVVIPTINLWTPFEVSETIAPGDAKKPRLLGIGSIAPPANAKESSILKVVLARVVGDTYTTNKGWGTGAANVALDSVDCHYRKNKIGTTTALPE